MPRDLHAVAQLPQFIRDAEQLELSADEQRTIIDTVAANQNEQSS
jgi:hypothetical protein